MRSAPSFSSSHDRCWSSGPHATNGAAPTASCRSSCSMSSAHRGHHGSGSHVLQAGTVLAVVVSAGCSVARSRPGCPAVSDCGSPRKALRTAGSTHGAGSAARVSGGCLPRVRGHVASACLDAASVQERPWPASHPRLLATVAVRAAVCRYRGNLLPATVDWRTAGRYGHGVAGAPSHGAVHGAALRPVVILLVVHRRPGRGLGRGVRRRNTGCAARSRGCRFRRLRHRLDDGTAHR